MTEVGVGTTELVINNGCLFYSKTGQRVVNILFLTECVCLSGVSLGTKKMVDC